MVRAFSEDEKSVVRAAIMQAGIARFERLGIRAVRVQDLCTAAGIAKGTFYTFFKSKEELFMDIAEERDRAHKVDMLAFVKDPGPSPRTGLFDMLMRKIETDPILSIVRKHGEMAYLVRKLPPERLQAEHQADAEFLQTIASQFRSSGAGPAATTEVLSAMMTLMLALSMQADFLTPHQYTPAKAALRATFDAALLGTISLDGTSL